MRTSFVSKTFESIRRFGKNDARKQDTAITYPSGRLCNLFFCREFIYVLSGCPVKGPIVTFGLIETTVPRMYQLPKNPPDRFKSTFQSVKLGNIHGHGWKDRLKISKLAEFETDLLKKMEFRKVAKF